jgi:hypothetical protein
MYLCYHLNRQVYTYPIIEEFMGIATWISSLTERYMGPDLVSNRRKHVQERYTGSATYKV